MFVAPLRTIGAASTPSLRVCHSDQVADGDVVHLIADGFDSSDRFMPRNAREGAAVGMIMKLMNVCVTDARRLYFEKDIAGARNRIVPLANAPRRIEFWCNHRLHLLTPGK
jgi:hypothetical protein